MILGDINLPTEYSSGGATVMRGKVSGDALMCVCVWHQKSMSLCDVNETAKTGNDWRTKELCRKSKSQGASAMQMKRRNGNASVRVCAQVSPKWCCINRISYQRRGFEDSAWDVNTRFEKSMRVCDVNAKALGNGRKLTGMCVTWKVNGPLRRK